MTNRKTRPAHADLARRAREVLAAGARLQLWVEGLPADDVTQAGLRVCERDGIPHLVCPAGHPLQDRIGARARLIVTAGVDDAPEAQPAITVVIEGRLCRIAQPALPDGAAAVALAPHAVISEEHRETGPIVTTRIPVEHFLAARIDRLDVHRRVVRTHFNTAHPEQLRDCAAQLSGQQPGEILSASLTALDCDSVALDWIDLAGTHRCRLGFTRPATDPNELDRLLHECLASAGSSARYHPGPL